MLQDAAEALRALHFACLQEHTTFDTLVAQAWVCKRQESPPWAAWYVRPIRRDCGRARAAQ